MAVWIILSLLSVLSVKYYTSVGMRKLDRRLASVKRDLDRSKSKRKEAEEEKSEIAREEELFEQRIRSMKDIIGDLEYRLTMRREDEEAEVVTDR